MFEKRSYIKQEHKSRDRVHIGYRDFLDDIPVKG